MHAVRLLAEGVFNSFRIGYTLRYQRSYVYPPKPTLIGLLGAALGLEDRELEDLYGGILTSVVLSYTGGLVKDLWGITKLKTGGKPEHAVVVREMIYRPIYWIYYAPAPSASEPTVERIKAAVQDPVYPLTLGRSDELVLIKSAEAVELDEAEAGNFYRRTALPFDYRKEESELEKVKPGEALELPSVFKIPLAYKYDEKRRRSASKYGTFTHVYATGVRLGKRKRGWRDGERYFFLY